MKRTLLVSAVLFLMSALFLTAVCESAGPASRPIIAKWSGTLYDVGVCLGVGSPEHPYIQTVNVGKGVSSVMGASSFIFVYCIDETFTGFGWGVVTSANGDTLRMSIPEVTLNLDTDPPEWSETEVVVGGTGKFEGAIGSSVSGGTWTSGADSFPWGTTESPPLVFMPPQGWVGTSTGEITF